MADFWNTPVWGTAAQPAQYGTANAPAVGFGDTPTTAAQPATGPQMTWGQFLSALWGGGGQGQMAGPTSVPQQGFYGQQQNPLWAMPQPSPPPLQGAKDDSGEVLSILSGIIGAPGAGAK